MTILGIGLEPDTSQALVILEKKGFHTIHATSFEEAERIVGNTDVSAVLVDSHATSSIKDDINKLLAETPITTKIFLITHPRDMISTEQFSALGIKTLDSLVSGDDLEQMLL